MSPCGAEGLAEIAHELRSDLPHGLGLSRELAHVVAVIDEPFTETKASMRDKALAPDARADQLHLLCPDVRGDQEPRPLARRRVGRALDLHESATRDHRIMRAARGEGMGRQRK